MTELLVPKSLNLKGWEMMLWIGTSTFNHLITSRNNFWRHCVWCELRKNVVEYNFLGIYYHIAMHFFSKSVIQNLPYYDIYIRPPFTCSSVLLLVNSLYLSPIVSPISGCPRYNQTHTRSCRFTTFQHPNKILSNWYHPRSGRSNVDINYRDKLGCSSWKPYTLVEDQQIAFLERGIHIFCERADNFK